MKIDGQVPGFSAVCAVPFNNYLHGIPRETPPVKEMESSRSY